MEGRINVKRVIKSFAHDSKSVERMVGRLMSAANHGCEHSEHLEADLYTHVCPTPTKQVGMSHPSFLPEAREEGTVESC